MFTMQGRNAVVFGVANKRSIAWSIAQRLSEAGASLVLTYQNARLKEEAHDLIASLSGAEAFQCDVSSDAEIDQLFARLSERFGRLDTLVHSVAFAPAEDLKADFLNTSREGFPIALDVTAYSLIAVSRAAAPPMPTAGSPITITPFAPHKAIPSFIV